VTTGDVVPSAPVPPAPRRHPRRSLRTRGTAADEEAPKRSLKAPQAADDGEETPAPRRSLKVVRSGWSAGEQMIDATSQFAQNFKPEETVQVIQFLEDAPYASYSRHWIERTVQGRKQTRTYTCLETFGESCPLCETYGDRPQATSAFNVALIGDDGVPVLKSWDVGVRIFKQLKGFNADPKIGPLTKGFYAVSRSGKGNNSTTNVIPVRASTLEEDYDTPVPAQGLIEALKLYDGDIIEVPKRSELQELADELADSGDYA
jgi:hypothetical protein